MLQLAHVLKWALLSASILGMLALVWMIGVGCDDMCRYDQFREKLERQGDICQYVEALVKMEGQ